MSTDELIDDNPEGFRVLRRVPKIGEELHDAWERAERAQALGRFSMVRGITKSLDDNAENRNTIMKPTKHTVYLVAASV